jgi:hypothetical protein
MTPSGSGSSTVATLHNLTPAAAQGWHVLFDLADTAPKGWVLVGGQMMYLLAAENGATLPRATDDVDVVMDVRLKPGATEWFADWLVKRAFVPDTPSADSIGHRLRRRAEPGPGRLSSTSSGRKV